MKLIKHDIFKLDVSCNYRKKQAQAYPFPAHTITRLGLDKSEEMLEKAKNLPAKFLAGEVTEIFLPDASVQYVKNSFTFHHTRQRRRWNYAVQAY